MPPAWIHRRPRFCKALALLQARRLAEAGALYAEVCKINPLDTESWFRLGTINLELSALTQAEACFRRVIELDPKLVIAYYNLGRSIELTGIRDDEAIAIYRKLLQIAPHFEAYYNIGVIYAHQAKFEDALEVYRQAQKIEPANPRLIAAEATIYEKQGEYDKAYERIRPLVEAGRESPEIAILLASLSRHLNCRPQAIETLERLLAHGASSGNKDVLIPMHFAVASLLDAAGEYDRAFYHFQQGNNLSSQAFDPKAYVEQVDAVIRIFSPEFVRTAPRAASRADNLIFILGMPRSGTSLVEQILDSHPLVYGCGELTDISDLARSLPDVLGIEEQYPQAVVSLTEESCEELAQRYLRRVRALSGNAAFVTDKMPQNFNLLGMMAMLFPGAKVIHCRRDPLDTCLSCYFQNFRYHHASMAFSTDLAKLGAYYKQYQRLMEHWKATLDIAMMDVDYEMMVADQEKLTRNILAFCGLPWDEKCLRFYDSGRAVTTASYNQVREPIYRKSVQRWQHYEKYLEPLKKALAD
ncbi:MAG: sulfotransferase [Gammaproteobacteria bacterium]